VHEPLDTDVLALDLLPAGHTTRLWFHLVHDALGNPVRIPVLVAKGRKEGPVVGVTAAVHGNELNGIPVIQRLFARLDPTQMRGTIVAVPVVNLAGFFREQRFYADSKDLNHVFPGHEGGNASSVYAARFTERILRHFQVLVDLHTASRGRVNSLYVRADMTDPQTARLAYLQRPEVIVHKEETDGTLRGAAAALGIPAVTVEIGDPQVFQAAYHKRAVQGVRAILGEMGLLPKRALSMGEPPLLCDTSSWLYTDHGGLLEVFPRVTQILEPNEEIAHVRNIWGDLVATYRAPVRSVVIGHATNPVALTGARIAHLGTLCPDDHPTIWPRAKVLPDEEYAG
jgi:predicted deacylase